MDSILERIQRVVAEQLDDDDVVLTPKTVASDVDGWDSLAHVRIIIAIEEEFGVRFQMSEITSVADVGDLVRMIEARLPA